MAKSKNRIGLEFEGFEDIVAELEGLQGDVRKATEESLKVANKVVAERLTPIMEKHKRTGVTLGSIRNDYPIEWEGLTASTKIGFDFAESGLTSIFLMYGTPRMPKVQGLYNAVYGRKTKKMIGEEQRKIFSEAIHKRMGE